MLNKNEIRGLVISIVLLTAILAGFYLVTILTMDSWIGFRMDLSEKVVEATKRVVTYVVQRIVSELRV